MARGYLKVLARQVLNNVGISGNRCSIAGFHSTCENLTTNREHYATLVDAGHAMPIRLQTVLQAGFGGNVPGCLHQPPIDRFPSRFRARMTRCQSLFSSHLYLIATCGAVNRSSFCRKELTAFSR